MTRSLTAMRVWLQLESEDIAIAQWKKRRTRAEARGIVIARLGLEMAQDDYDIKNYQADVDEIVDSVLDRLYGTEETKVETLETMEAHATTDLSSNDAPDRRRDTIRRN
jgi:hypothetical protein